MSRLKVGQITLKWIEISEFVKSLILSYISNANSKYICCYID